jgi:hypothetical protein
VNFWKFPTVPGLVGQPGLYPALLSGSGNFHAGGSDPAATREPKDPPRSRLLDRLGLAPSSIAPIGNFPGATALIAFTVAGLTAFTDQGWWRPVAIAAAGISLLVILLFWHPRTVNGAVVDGAILVAPLGAHRPPTRLVRRRIPVAGTTGGTTACSGGDESAPAACDLETRIPAPAASAIIGAGSAPHRSGPGGTPSPASRARARTTTSPTAVAVRFVFGLIAFGVGAVPEVLLRPRVGEPTAHAIGTLIAVAPVALVIHAYIRRVHASCARADLLRIGLFWPVLTVVFEFGFFHSVVGNPWDVLLTDYNLRRGRFWVLVLATVLLGPLLVGTIPGCGEAPAPSSDSGSPRRANRVARSGGGIEDDAPSGDGPPVAGRRTGPGGPTSDEAGGKMAMR